MRAALALLLLTSAQAAPPDACVAALERGDPAGLQPCFEAAPPACAQVFRTKYETPEDRLADVRAHCESAIPAATRQAFEAALAQPNAADRQRALAGLIGAATQLSAAQRAALVAVLATRPVVVSPIEIPLPRATPNPGPLGVQLRADGTLRVTQGGQPVACDGKCATPALMARTLARLGGRAPQVVIQADAAVPYARVVAAIDAIRAATPQAKFSLQVAKAK